MQESELTDSFKNTKDDQINENDLTSKCEEYETRIKNLMHIHNTEKAILNKKVELTKDELNDLKDRFLHQQEVSKKMFSALNDHLEDSYNVDRKSIINQREHELHELQKEIESLKSENINLKADIKLQVKETKVHQRKLTTLNEEFLIMQKENNLKIQKLEYENSKLNEELRKQCKENSLLKSKLNKIEDLSSFQLREQESEHLKQLEELRSIQEMERNKLETRIEILMLDLKRMSESALFTDTTLINNEKELKQKLEIITIQLMMMNATIKDNSAINCEKINKSRISAKYCSSVDKYNDIDLKCQCDRYDNKMIEMLNNMDNKANKNELDINKLKIDVSSQDSKDNLIKDLMNKLEIRDIRNQELNEEILRLKSFLKDKFSGKHRCHCFLALLKSEKNEDKNCELIKKNERSIRNSSTTTKKASCDNWRDPSENEFPINQTDELIYKTPVRSPCQEYNENSFGFERDFNLNRLANDTLNHYDLNKLTPLQDKNINVTSTGKHQRSTKILDSCCKSELNLYDEFMRKTMNKLEATESKNSFLHMQTKFVKNALSKLTDKLRDEENPSKNKRDIVGIDIDHLLDQNFEQSLIFDQSSQNEFCRLTIESDKILKNQHISNNKHKRQFTHTKVSNNEFELNNDSKCNDEISLKSYFRDSKINGIKPIKLLNPQHLFISSSQKHKYEFDKSSIHPLSKFNTLRKTDEEVLQSSPQISKNNKNR